MIYPNYDNYRFAPIELLADLKVSCLAGTIDIQAKGNNVIIRLPSLRCAFVILTSLGGRKSFADILKLVDQTLKSVDVTLFWQSSHFAILGSKAKPYFLKILILIQKISKLSALGTYRQRPYH